MVIERIRRFRTEAVTHDGLALLDQSIGQAMHLTGYAIRRVRWKLFGKESDIDTNRPF